MFFYQDQRKDRQVTMEIDSQKKKKKKKAELTKKICVYLFFPVYLFSRNMDFVLFRVYLFSRMTFKRKFRVYLILRNRPNFAKFAKICTREN